MVITQGDVCWADLGEPVGSAPGFRRPVVVVQSNELNRSKLETVLCVTLTSNLKWAQAPGNVIVRAAHSKLPRDSVANVSQIATLDRSQLTERLASLPERQVSLILDGIALVLGRPAK